MRTSRRGVPLAVVAAATAVLSLAGSGAAHASDAGIQAWNPCAGVYYTYNGFWKYGHVVNNCATTTIRVMADWNWVGGADSYCYTLGPRREFVDGPKVADAYIQEVRNC